MKIYLDGQFVEDDKARISVFDAGLQHGVGLFETMRAYNGVVFRLRQHIDRLITSANELGLSESLRGGPLREAVELTLEKNKLDEARIRLTISGGDMALLPAPGKTRKTRHQPTVVIVATEPTVYPTEFFQEGVTVVIADPKANPLNPAASHKTLNYWMRLRALAAAAGAGAAEALWFTVSNHLCGGSVSNAILIKDEQVLTPIARGEEPDGAIPSPVLPGITRAAVLEAAEELDLPIHRKMLTINDVLEADEIMLTNSSWGVLPVVKVEREAIGGGKVGPLTARLAEALSAMIRRDCGPVPDQADSAQRPPSASAADNGD